MVLTLTKPIILEHRNKVLANSDGQIAEDIFRHTKTQWKDYRQSLRDLPYKMQAGFTYFVT